MPRINVTKSFLPEKKEFLKYVDAMWESAWLTNNGPFLQELEKKLGDFLPLQNLLVCGNGTIVLQMALKAFGIKKQVITTPFSYVATLNAIIWENCEPVFVDIDPTTLCIDANKIEAAVTGDTEAILCTHVYGYPCDVDKIAEIAGRHNLKVIYDAAHAFGAKLRGRSLLSYGDASTCSFHATKLFHSVEGGLIATPHKEVFDALYKLRQFGHIYDDYYVAGINGKNSELHAAMGLCVLPHVNEIIRERKKIAEYYDTNLK
ncbi:MAG: DegT/DnrJ/EryC1/StrS family aminotransferase, partial [Chitinophagaceae bacterium]